jgi:hypothetical protein
MEKTEDKFKKNIYDGLQLAYKVTANSLYGQVGAPTSPIYLKELAASTTATGREMLEYSRDFIQGIFGELINLAIHDKNEYIKKSEELYKDVPENKFIDSRNNRNNMNDFIKYFYDKVNSVLTPQYRIKPVVIYGDSVTHDTPILLLNKNNQIEIKTIDDIGRYWTEHNVFKSNVEGLSEKEQDSAIPYKVWSDKGWTDIKRVIRHKTNKRIYEVLTHAGCVRVTSDHSLLDINGNQLKPTECKIGTELLHLTPVIPNVIFNEETKMDLEKAFNYGFFFGVGNIHECNEQYIKEYRKKFTDSSRNNEIISGAASASMGCCFADKNGLKIIPNEIINGSYSEKKMFLDGYIKSTNSLEKTNNILEVNGQITAFNLYCLIVSLNYNVYIDKKIDNKYIITYTNNFDPNSNKIKKITDIGFTDDYVYDLETDIGHFHAGVGSMIVKNTDSVFFSPKIHDIDTKEIKTDKEALAICIEIGKLAGATICKVLPDPQEQVYEKTLWPFVILTKKRYVGNLYEDSPDKFYQKSMGIVLKRRDNAKIVKIVVGGIVDYILNGKPGETSIKERNQGAIDYTRLLLKKILRGEFSIDNFIISKTLRGEYKNRTRIVHAVLADRIAQRDPGNKPDTNDRIPYVYIIPNKKVLLQGERVEDPKYVIENNLELDYLFYITNQIMKPSVQFLELIAKDVYKLFENYINKEINRRKNVPSIMDYVTAKTGSDSDNISKSDNTSNSDNNYTTNNNIVKKNKSKKSFTIEL